MANSLFVCRLSHVPFTFAQAVSALRALKGSRDYKEFLDRKGNPYVTANVDVAGWEVHVRSDGEGRCFIVHQANDDSLAVALHLCKWMEALPGTDTDQEWGVFDEEYSFFVAVTTDETVQSFWQKAQQDPFAGEVRSRMLYRPSEPHAEPGA